MVERNDLANNFEQRLVNPPNKETVKSTIARVIPQSCLDQFKQWVVEGMISEEILGDQLDNLGSYALNFREGKISPLSEIDIKLGSPLRRAETAADYMRQRFFVPLALGEVSSEQIDHDPIYRRGVDNMARELVRWLNGRGADQNEKAKKKRLVSRREGLDELADAFENHLSSVEQALASRFFSAALMRDMGFPDRYICSEHRLAAYLQATVSCEHGEGLAKDQCAELLEAVCKRIEEETIDPYLLVGLLLKRKKIPDPLLHETEETLYTVKKLLSMAEEGNFQSDLEELFAHHPTTEELLWESEE